jgi:hypothetical protein
MADTWCWRITAAPPLRGYRLVGRVSVSDHLLKVRYGVLMTMIACGCGERRGREKKEKFWAGRVP